LSGVKERVMATTRIVLERARENNLKDITLDLPRRAIVAIVGVSGAGKSSLLFDTIAAESVARHEAVATTAARRSYARRPTVEKITGLPYCINVAQRSIHRSPRSTLATFTGIHDALRSLVISTGEVRCTCGADVPPPNAQMLSKFLLANHASAKVAVCAVVVRSRKATLRQELTALRKEGYDSVLVQIEDDDPRREHRLSRLQALSRAHRNTLTVVIGSIVIGKRVSSELQDLIEQAHLLGEGDIYFRGSGRRKSDAFELETGLMRPCPKCHTIVPLPTASLLSFNAEETRSGRCRSCFGIGTVRSVAFDTLVPDPTKSIADGCFALLVERGSYKHLSIREDVVRGVCKDHKQSTSVPFAELSKELRVELLWGTEKRRVLPLNSDGKKSGSKVIFHGLIPSLLKQAIADGAAGEYARSYVISATCDACNGTRFDRERVDRYRYHGRSFTDILAQTALEAKDTFPKINTTCENEGHLSRVMQRTLEAIVRSGLGYVRLDRGTSTLSGGELQRLKIASSLGSGLMHCCYVLDEPSLGLHAVDNRGLIETITELRDLGNTILLADHDPDFCRAADFIVELGPSGGSRGGEVVYVGKDTVRSRRSSSAKISRRSAKPTGRFVHVQGCTAHNLRNIDVEIPLGGFVCLTGVSGSGKSSFAHHVLVPAVTAFQKSRRTSGPTWKGLDGAAAINAISSVGQQAIGASSASLIATYLGVYDHIRKLFAQTEVARARGYTPAHFSFNRPEGQCGFCGGRGELISSERSATRVECPACGGTRFVDAVLDVRYEGLSVSEVLCLEIDSALDVFDEIPSISTPLRLLCDFGLGYLQIGRTTTTLSGGECQRLKIAYALSQLGGHPEGLVFILDEPTAGLHRKDVQALVKSLDWIIDGGRNTLLVIEHDLDMIRAADHIIDFGPGAGGEGGQIVYAGPPSKAHDAKASRTGEALRSRRLSQSKDVTKMRSTEPRVKGVHAANTISPQLASMAVRFSRRAKKEHGDEAVDDEEAGLIAPTYLLSGGKGSSYPLLNRTILENLRLSDLLFRVIGDLACWPMSDEVFRVRDVASAMKIRDTYKSEIIVACSPIAALLEARKATRTELGNALRHAVERGFVDSINALGEISAIDTVLTDNDGTDVFGTRIVVGTLGSNRGSARLILSRGLETGGGWVTLYKKNRRGVCSFIGHLTDRPIDSSERLVGRRRWVPGIFDRRDVGACRFCSGTGHCDTIDLNLILADRKKSPCDPSFLHPDCARLLRPVWNRVTACLKFFSAEGLAPLVDARKRWKSEDWHILCNGYPWARFLISGRAGKKNIDYHEWTGLIPLVLGRLHLSKNRRWAGEVEASRGPALCSSCNGTGYDWLARYYRLGEDSVAEWLASRTLLEAHDFLTRNGKKIQGNGALMPALSQLIRVGLGHVKITATCRDLSAEECRRMRSLAVCQLGFAESTYCIGAADKDSAWYAAESELLNLAATDRRIVCIDDLHGAPDA